MKEKFRFYKKRIWFFSLTMFIFSLVFLVSRDFSSVSKSLSSLRDYQKKDSYLYNLLFTANTSCTADLDSWQKKIAWSKINEFVSDNSTLEQMVILDDTCWFYVCDMMMGVTYKTMRDPSVTELKKYCRQSVLDLKSVYEPSRTDVLLNVLGRMLIIILVSFLPFLFILSILLKVVVVIIMFLVLMRIVDSSHGSELEKNKIEFSQKIVNDAPSPPLLLDLMAELPVLVNMVVFLPELLLLFFDSVKKIKKFIKPIWHIPSFLVNYA